ncbi:MAG: hypothetical protein OXH02_11760 [Gemmatimonadetes bacterium]|nr:hypothetical protein [Gemmatimonadota bacterium]
MDDRQPRVDRALKHTDRSGRSTRSVPGARLSPSDYLSEKDRGMLVFKT